MHDLIRQVSLYHTNLAKILINSADYCTYILLYINILFTECIYIGVLNFLGLVHFRSRAVPILLSIGVGPITAYFDGIRIS